MTNPKNRPWWYENVQNNELLSDWMGCNAEETIPVKFNGKVVGTWEVSVAMADGQDVIIRRPAAASVIPDESKYLRV